MFVIFSKSSNFKAFRHFGFDCAIANGFALFDLGLDLLDFFTPLMILSQAGGNLPN